MSLIPRLAKTEKDPFTVRLDRSTAEELRRYCEFLQSPQDYVITQALQMVFRKDKDFAEWCKTQSEGPSASTANSEPEGLKVKKTSGA